MAVLAILPVAGATLVWAPAAIWLALSGSLVKGVIFLALVGLLILGNIDNVVRPLMLSASCSHEDAILIVCLLGGASAFGFIGIVLGPVVAAVFTALVESYQLQPEEEQALAAAAPPPKAPGAPEPPEPVASRDEPSDPAPPKG